MTQVRNINDDILVFYNKNEKPFISVPHLHSQYEIYYNISGASGFMVSGKLYKCKGRDLILVPKTEAHKVIVNKNASYERCIINVNEYAVGLMKAICKTDEPFLWLENGAKIVNLSAGQHKKFMGIIGAYTESKHPLKSVSCLFDIFSFLEEAFKNHQNSEFMEEDAMLPADRIILLAEKNFRYITVSEIAKKMHIDEDYLTRIFKAETGMTIKKYLITRKLAEAKKHLFSGKSAKEACLLAGFRDYTNFIRTFKKYEGISPSELKELTERI